MLTQINFFLLLYLISYILNQSIDYESACKNIYIASKKDCSPVILISLPLSVQNLPEH